LSLAYNVTGNGKIAFKASYGRYMDSSSGPNSQPGPGASDINPNATKMCTFNNWNGAIPFVPAPGQKPSTCTSGNWDVATQKIVGNATTIRFGTLKLNPNYVDEYTTGLEVAFTHDYTMRFNVVRKFDYIGTNAPTTSNPKGNNLAEPFPAYTDLRTAPDPGPDGILGTPDDTGKTLYVWSIPASYPTKGQTDTVISNLRRGEGKSQFTAYEVTFNKQYSNGWAALASFNVDLGHVNTPDALNPNQLWYKFDAPVWNQAIKLNAQYALPLGFKWAGTLTGQSGAWYPRTAQITAADRTLVTVNVEQRAGRYDWVNLWDNRISKLFKLTENQSVEGIFDLFNTMNSNTITSWSTASGPTYHRPLTILPPRIFRLSARYRF